MWNQTLHDKYTSINVSSQKQSLVAHFKNNKRNSKKPRIKIFLRETIHHEKSLLHNSNAQPPENIPFNAYHEIIFMDASSKPARN